MGSLFSCFRVENSDLEDTGPMNPLCGSCICCGLLVPQWWNVNTRFRRDVHALPSSVQGPSGSQVIADDSSMLDTYRAPPRPLAYDDPRFSSLNRSLLSRCQKASNHYHEESEPLMRYETTCTSDKRSVREPEEKFRYGLCESSLKHQTLDSTGAIYFYPSPEDEDDCPTCLEEFTTENPRITLQCSHQFHLGCIYEWKERSEACPICGKVMVFDEE